MGVDKGFCLGGKVLDSLMDLQEGLREKSGIPRTELSVLCVYANSLCIELFCAFKEGPALSDWSDGEITDSIEGALWESQVR